MTKVFVYGTLKQGYVFHHIISHCKFIGKNIIKGTMYDLGGCPMVDISTPFYDIHGEVYEVDDATLANLDRLENYPALYDRTLIKLLNNVEVWVYHKIVRPYKIVDTGKW